MIESRREEGEERISGECGGEYKECWLSGDIGGDKCELLPRRALHVGHILTNRDISSFGTL